MLLCMKLPSAAAVAKIKTEIHKPNLKPNLQQQQPQNTHTRMLTRRIIHGILCLLNRIIPARDLFQLNQITLDPQHTHTHTL